ncbi:MAG: hypothetical protein ABWZ88_03300 [Variovorax sp.]
MPVAHDLMLEFARMGVVFAHLIACCIAMGLVLTSDIAMVRQLYKGDPTDRIDMQRMKALQSTVSAALIALWATGLMLVALDTAVRGWDYFANPKLQAKILIVVLLTLNGLVLHRYVLPWMQNVGTLLRLPPRQAVFATFSGAVSGASWLYAALLGVGRPLSWKYSLFELLAAYPLLVAGGFMGMLALTAIGRHRESRSTLPREADAAVG